MIHFRPPIKNTLIHNHFQNCKSQATGHHASSRAKQTIYKRNISNTFDYWLKFIKTYEIMWDWLIWSEIHIILWIYFNEFQWIIKNLLKIWLWHCNGAKLLLANFWLVTIVTTNGIREERVRTTKFVKLTVYKNKLYNI